MKQGDRASKENGVTLYLERRRSSQVFNLFREFVEKFLLVETKSGDVARGCNAGAADISCNAVIDLIFGICLQNLLQKNSNHNKTQHKNRDRF